MGGYQVFGYCNPMVEQIIKVDDSFIEVAGLQKAGSNLLNEEDYRKVEELIEKKGVEIIEALAGGSGSNISAGLASLEVETCFFGGIGDDAHGAYLEEEMQRDYGVHPLLVRKDSPTCTIFTLITPDKERTFAVCLEAAQKLEPKDIPLDALVNSEYIVVTGYKIQDSPQTTFKLIEEAKKYDKKIVLDLSCGLHIKNGKELFDRVLERGVHILLANEEETEVYCGVKKGSKLEEYSDVIEEYLTFSDIVVQKLGERGAMVATKDEGLKVSPFEVKKVPAFEVDVVNLNGAGDGFAIGLVYGLINYKNLATAARLANYCASRVIMQVGPRMGFHKKDLESVVLEDKLNQTVTYAIQDFM